MGQKLGLYAQGKVEGGGEITINTQDVWQFVNTILPDLGSNFGLELVAGETQAITAFADGGGGEVTVTSAGHGLSAGDYITISGTTNYNDVYEVQSVDGNNFNITETFNGDDATGDYHRGTAGCVSAGGGGKYLYIWTVSFEAAAANKDFEFDIYVNTTPTTPVDHEFTAGATRTTINGQQILELEAGDCLSFALRNTTDNSNITIDDGTWSMFKIG